MLVGIMLVLDIYVFQAVRTIIPTGSRWRLFFIVVYWALAVGALALLISFPYLNFDAWPAGARTYLLSFLVAIFFSKLVASGFLAVDDLRRGATWLVTRLFSNPSIEVSQQPEGITRSVFLSWLGLAAGGGLFSAMAYGLTNKYNYHVNRLSLQFDNLPAAFRGLRVVHISDIHAGSFTDRKAVEKGVEKILKEKPDLIVFTGDLVNDRAIEMEDYMDVFGRLNAPMGVYSTLGNHDYGDYFRWSSQAEKTANLEALKQVHGRLGWKLLMNEHVALEREGQQVALLGVENWSAKGNFPRYGVLKEAYAGAAAIPFKLLLSHDPSHWDGEVREKFPDIDLMLSGHTHGMQFGIEVPGFKWSPVQYMYKQWAGLYENGHQKLYINRGYGFIGYPGRVGILPEITVITLT